MSFNYIILEIQLFLLKWIRRQEFPLFSELSTRWHLDLQHYSSFTIISLKV